MYLKEVFIFFVEKILFFNRIDFGKDLFIIRLFVY